MSAAAGEELLLADECWVALALLHREQPDRISFSAREIVERLKKEGAHGEVRAGVQPHIYQHNVANVAPSSARYRMFYRTEDGTYRLFRPGDDFHPARKGKTLPERSELPARYHELLDWCQNEYCGRAREPGKDSDPILQMLGLGREIWLDEGADAYVARERAGWDESEPADSNSPAANPVAHRAWKRAVAHQGEEFHTAKELPFTYSVEGSSGMWFYRNGERIPQRLWRGDFEKAVNRCPLSKVTDVKDCRDSSYLYGLLTDRRIRDGDW